MKLLKQTVIIFSIYSIADILSKILKLPIPGNVIGMFILFFLLLAGIIKENHVDEISDLLINNMGLIFIPGTLSILDEYKYVKDEIIPFLIVCVFVTIIIMISTGLLAQFLQNILSKLRKKIK